MFSAGLCFEDLQRFAVQRRGVRVFAGSLHHEGQVVQRLQRVRVLAAQRGTAAIQRSLQHGDRLIRAFVTEQSGSQVIGTCQRIGMVFAQ